jgi:fatty acid desaturase
MAPNMESSPALEPVPVTGAGAGLRDDDDEPTGGSAQTRKEISHLSREAAKVKVIRDAIRSEDKRLRETYPLLSTKYQDVTGLAIYLGSLTLWAAVSWMWAQGLMSTGLTILLNALIISFLHEMEHDLIHDLYFKRLPFVQHLMFFGIWLIKSNAAPWWRKHYHLKHHQESGQVTDVEERLIGLGLPWWNPKRILVTLTPAATLLVGPDIQRDDPSFSIVNMFLANAPTVTASSVSMIFHGVMAWAAAAKLLESHQPDAFALLQWLLPYMVAYNVTINFPNVLRQSCLVVISTYCHYYGDIPEHDVYFQVRCWRPTVVVLG